MKIIKPFSLGVLHRPYPVLGQSRCAVAALGFFQLGAEQLRLLPDAEQWARVLPLLPAGMALDDVIPKPHGEALLLGDAHAPDGKPVPCMCVRMQVGAIDKTIRVVGERGWRQRATPAPFTSLSLSWARAFGGPRHPANPDGRGYTGLFGARRGCMPNLEYPGQPVSGGWRRLPPACFGPVPAEWSPRNGKLGTYKARWLAQEAPGFASDIDWSAFNRASTDQWLPGYFDAAEAYRLEGVHPSRPVIEGRLPAIVARAFLLAPKAAAESAREVPLLLDTVWFLPGLELGIMVFHGEIAIGDSDGLDIGALMVAYEQVGAPRPLSHYHEVLRLRSDPLLAAEHLFNESQLAPLLPAETLAQQAAEDAASCAAALASQQQQLDELEADFWQASGKTRPPGQPPLQAQAPLLEAPSARARAAGDFDLGPMLRQAKALGEQARQQAAEQLATLAAIPAPPEADSEAQFAKALEAAIVPAYDLLPPEEAGNDPVLAEQLAQLEVLRQQGALSGAQSYDQARAAVQAAPAQRRAARRAASAAPARTLDSTAAARLGEQIRHWHLCGIRLAGRDLAGADLRGIDLRGADLRDTLFDNADLSGARLAGANLSGAVLAGACLAGADLGGACLDRANLAASIATDASLRQASLCGAHAQQASWRGVDLSEARLDDLLAMGIDLTGAKCDGVHAASATLIMAVADGSSWRGAVLDGMVALRSSFAAADFRAAQISQCSFNEAVLRGSDWQDANWNGMQAAGATDLSGATLRGLHATDSGLHGAMLPAADLRAAHFLRCDFGACDLRGARLDSAHFPHCVFMAADLSGASARDADFFRALLRKATLRDADLTGARTVQAEMTGAA